jgi:hypothetical protein
MKRKPEPDLTQIALNRPRSVTAKILYVVLIGWGVVALVAMFALSSR